MFTGLNRALLFRRKTQTEEIGLGHECAGTVVAVGSRVSKFKPGDRVNIEPGVPCGHCRYCLEGKYNICPDVDFMATQPNYRGALTHYLCHPESFTYKLPDNMGTMEGALVEPAAVGMHAAMLADVKPRQENRHPGGRLYWLNDPASL